jgi:colanic acid biosynthesis protein WcaH
MDLLVRTGDGLVFGMRENDLAAGYWFVPGARVKNRETRTEAVHRVAEDELGADVQIVESLGAYEHIYDTADIEGVDGKHYLANGYVVEATTGEFETDN